MAVFDEKQKKNIPLILSNATSQNVILSNFRTNMCQDLIGNDHVRNPIKQNSDLYIYLLYLLNVFLFILQVLVHQKWKVMSG